jgi:uncharacterized MAPEG superfamily protein
MTIANTCVLAAALLPVLTIGLAKGSTAGKKRREGGYDNNDPRGWATQLAGWQARASAAQNNGFEALPLFVFAVLAAQMAGLDQARTDQLAMVFVGLRLAYVGAYLANVGAVRTLIWAAAAGVAIAIFAPTLALPF